MSTNRKPLGLFKSITKSYKGCGGCAKPKLSEVVEPTTLIPKTLTIHENPSTNDNNNDTCCHSSSFSSDSSDKKFGDTLEGKEDEDLFTSTTTLSAHTLDTPSSSTHCCSESENDPRNYKIVAASPFIKMGDSIAVVKESDDPFNDFRNSMHQMVLEQRIYSKDGLEELLHCFLQLNSPLFHDVIIKAFTEIWHAVMSDKKIIPKQYEKKRGPHEKVASTLN